MSKSFWIVLPLGLLAVALIVGGVLFKQRGDHLDPQGKILKVRVQAMDEGSAVLVADFRVINSSDREMAIRNLSMSVETAEGVKDGSGISIEDTKNLFKVFPLLGEIYNDPIHRLETIAPHASVDRMLAERFEVPAAQLDKRKKVTIRLEDMSGPVADITGK